LALHAQGYAGMGRTGEAAHDVEVKRALGLGTDDAIVGFLYTGTPAQTTPELTRPDAAAHVEEWHAPVAATA
jgi:hypothetical protein